MIDLEIKKNSERISFSIFPNIGVGRNSNCVGRDNFPKFNKRVGDLLSAM